MVNIGDRVECDGYGKGTVVSLKKVSDYDCIVKLDIKKNCYYNEEGIDLNNEKLSTCRLFWFSELEIIEKANNELEIEIW